MNTEAMREKVEALQKLRSEIRHLQSGAYDVEINIVRQLVEDGCVHCLRVNYTALARHYKCLKVV